MTREELELLTDIHDFTTLHAYHGSDVYSYAYCLLCHWRSKDSDPKHRNIRDMEGTSTYSTMRVNFAFFKHSFYHKRRLLKRVPYLFLFVIRENEILIAVIRDSLFFLFVNRARHPPPCTTLSQLIFP